MAQGRTTDASPLFSQVSSKLASYFGNNLQTGTSVSKSEFHHTMTAQLQNLAQRIHTPSQIAVNSDREDDNSKILTFKMRVQEELLKNVMS